MLQAELFSRVRLCSVDVGFRFSHPAATSTSKLAERAGRAGLGWQARHRLPDLLCCFCLVGFGNWEGHNEQGLYYRYRTRTYVLKIYLRSTYRCTGICTI